MSEDNSTDLRNLHKICSRIEGKLYSIDDKLEFNDKNLEFYFEELRTKIYELQLEVDNFKQGNQFEMKDLRSRIDEKNSKKRGYQILIGLGLWALAMILMFGTELQKTTISIFN